MLRLPDIGLQYPFDVVGIVRFESPLDDSLRGV
jgi:hypothetical protein